MRVFRPRPPAFSGLHPFETTFWAVLIGSVWLVSLLYITGAEVTLAWDPSPDVGVASYRVHWGTNSAAYTSHTNAGSSLSCTVPDLVPGFTYYFAATAVGTNQLESDFSNEVAYRVPIPAPSIHSEPAVLVIPRGLTSTNLGTWQPFDFTPTLLGATNPAQWFAVTGLSIRATGTPAP